MPFPSIFAKRIRRRLLNVLAVLCGSILFGTCGFSVLEGWPLLDSLYMTVMTVTTIGYGEVHPLSDRGRTFAVIYMLVGACTAAYAFSSLVQTLIQSEVIALYGAHRRWREMHKLHSHFIICGAGRVGSRIIRELQRTGVRYVIVEKEERKVAEYIERGCHVLVRDATREETLREAGIERARGLAACLADDADNLYVVLTARDLNKSLHIVARGVEEEAESKLIRAGASRVVSPTIIGSHRMAQALIKPALADFMDSITAENLDLGFEQVEIAPGSVYVNRELRETDIRAELEIVVVAIRRAGGERIFNPAGETRLEVHDLLIAIGRAESLATMTRLAQGGRK
ncbi:MAG TPA: potassium channel protein [Pyrinomonadaceae bacterium]|jgi:voltage-gated potassium channel|nr:potassium channel protein [Pyrinomonadaceae bacterium]